MVDDLRRLQDYFAAKARFGLRRTEHGYAGQFAELELHSHFQPLIRAAGLRPVAYEALLRARPQGSGGPFVAPETALAAARNAEEAMHLDRLCRVVHAANFARQTPGGLDLYLNVSGRHLLAVSNNHGSTFEELLACCGLEPQRVVLEILESSVEDLALLQEAVTAYKRRGFRIAIDDFGCRHSNFDRLWQIEPDLVKLDRGLVQQAVANPRAALILPRLIGMIRDLGAEVVCEGIETAEQHARCVAAGADLLQGYHYARPAPRLQAFAALAATG